MDEENKTGPQSDNEHQSQAQQSAQASQEADKLLAEAQLKEISQNGIKINPRIPYHHVSRNDFVGGIPGRRQRKLTVVIVALFVLYMIYRVVTDFHLLSKI
jgi:hypothetical protein